MEEQVINGSNIVFLAENIDEVWGYIKGDPYWQNNVVSSTMLRDMDHGSSRRCSGIRRRQSSCPVSYPLIPRRHKPSLALVLDETG